MQTSHAAKDVMVKLSLAVKHKQDIYLDLGPEYNIKKQFHFFLSSFEPIFLNFKQDMFLLTCIVLVKRIYKNKDLQ